MKKIFIGTLCLISALTACTSKTTNSTDKVDSSCEDSLYAELREREIQDKFAEFRKTLTIKYKGQQVIRFID